MTYEEFEKNLREKLGSAGMVDAYVFEVAVLRARVEILEKLLSAGKVFESPEQLKALQEKEYEKYQEGQEEDIGPFRQKM